MPGPADPTKPITGNERIRKGLEKIAKPIEGLDERPPEPPVKPAKPAEKPVTPPVTDPNADADPNAPDPEAPPTPPADPKTGKKVSPWKLYEAEKTARATAEKQLQEMKASLVPEQERKTITERLTVAEKRAAELEEHIRFVDYSKSSEFQTKYQQPYLAAWKRAMSELGELNLTDPGTQQARKVTSDDILQLVNLPLQQAREVADNLFGVFANDVMGHRKEIRALFDNQAAALDEAKKNGATRITQMQEAYRKQNEELSQQIQTTWTKVNEEALTDPKMGEYFKPKEGNEDWNQRLAKGYALADRAYAENPRDPKLTAEQRASAIKRHAAVRNRAAGWGPLKWENGQLKTQLEELKAELSKYRTQSTPPAGGSSTAAHSGPQTAMGRVQEALRKIARPGN
jgi:hypothetical protein